MSFEKVNNPEQTQELENKVTNFENDFDITDKRFDTTNNPIMKAIAENYDKDDLGNTLEAVLKNKLGNNLSGLSDSEQAEYEEIKIEFAEQLKLKEGPEAILELAENIKELVSLVNGTTGGKAKNIQDGLDYLTKEERQANKSRLEFADKMAKFIKTHNEKQAQKQAENTQKAKEANKAGNEEHKTASIEAEDSLNSEWPPADII